tara:strand:+ start:10797 stop:11084 length:288 start_codon:yes stop_codon:yes gene_type:complete
MAKKKTAKSQSQPQASGEEQVGFHKGALATLAKEREELGRILQIVEQLMQMHVKALKDLGIDLEKAAKEAQKAGGGTATPAAAGRPKKPIEDLLR